MPQCTSIQHNNKGDKRKINKNKNISVKKNKNVDKVSPNIGKWLKKLAHPQDEIL
jgi:hypothetical protein